ncbi:MAG: hypothetical protein FJW86_06435 [Actinobacteria bacterium]|nr:hypothetical protein [Actinomycetota bacterium]
MASDGDGRKWWPIPLAILLAGVVIGAGIAIGSGGGDNDETASTSTSTSTTIATAPSGGSGGGGGSAQPSPSIDSFGFAENPYVCGHQIQQDTISLPISWATSNATAVTLGAPGSNQQVEVDGTRNVDVQCPEINATNTLTYTLTASRPGAPDATSSTTLTISTDD